MPETKVQPETKKGRRGGRRRDEFVIVHVFNENPTREDYEKAADGLDYVDKCLADHARERDEPPKKAA
jgi:hypothetical protein